MRESYTRYLKLLKVPIILAILSLIWFAIEKIFNLPSTEELAFLVEGLYEQYGYPIILVSSFIEGILLAGNYFPGGLVIFLGVILASGVPEVILVVSIVTVGLFTGYLIDYVLGRYGWYVLLSKFGFDNAIEKAKIRLNKHAGKAFAISYGIPNLAALTATAAGITRFKLKKFLLFSLVATVLWNIFWGTLVYTIGENIFALTGFGAVVVILVIWTVILIVGDRISKYRDGTNTQKPKEEE